MTEILESIEKSLLPEGCHFSEEQKLVIFEDNSMDVVAGPGTGKTTVLVARIKILLEKMKDSSEGICVLTHTNVAVDEIKSSLRKLGVEEVKSPHFIGTIQDFFNTFFAKKAFHLILGDKKMRVLDDDVFRERFNEQFRKYYENLITKKDAEKVPDNLPNPSGKIDKWNFSQGSKPVKIESTVGRKNNKYNRAFNSSIEKLFKVGIITNHCCLEMSRWYIEQYQKKLSSIISKRFSHLLLDEAQDTSKLQFDLIFSLFDDQNVVIQKFGDPYQAIYNIWGGDSELAWKIDSSKEKRISKTSRFGHSIATIVKNVCIEKYDDLSSDSKHDSFPPYFIIYDDGTDLLEKYKRLIDKLEKEDCCFRSSKKSKIIVSVKHDDLKNTFGERYQRVISKKIAQTNDLDLFSGVFLKQLSRKVEGDFEDGLKMDNRLKIFRMIKELRFGTGENIITDLKNLLGELNLNELLLENKDDLCNEIKELLQNTFSQSSQILSTEAVKDVDKDIGLGTIHSVKGETHKATLLMLDSKFTVRCGEKLRHYPMLELLEKYLRCEYVELSTYHDVTKKKEVSKALKLAYVALSRPTHLVCIGIPKTYLDSNSRIADVLKNTGWQQFLA